MLSYLLLLATLALIPAIVLIYLVASHDKIEREPKKLLFNLVLFGALSIVPAALIESVISSFLNIFFLYESNLYYILESFIVAGLVEESCKYFFLKNKSWNDPNFNYKFDAILYSVCVSLGFAGVENILYIFRNGFSLVLPRALLSIPGHACFAVIMGHFYGKAKLFQNLPSAKSYKLKAILIPASLHGLFNSLLLIGSHSFIAISLYAIYIIILYIFTFRLIRKASREDQQIVK